MKKLLLTGVTALFLATGAAHARPISTTLPAEMQGSWCEDEDDNPWGTLHRNDKCKTEDRWLVTSDSWQKNNKGHELCIFSVIKELDLNVYFVRGICEGKGNATNPEYIPNGE